MGKTVSEDELNSETRTTRVTLSVPAVEVQLTNDIVFVVDGSDCSYYSVTKLIEMLHDLYDAEQASSMTNHVGIIFFRGSAVRAYDLGDLTEERINEIESHFDQSSPSAFEDNLTDWLAENHQDYITNGSNLDAGLTEAKEMLDEDASTPAANKHVITITDGLTYEFVDDDGTAKTVYQTNENNEATNLLELWYDKWGLNHLTREAPDGFTWENYYETISAQVQADGDTYVAGLYDLAAYLQTDVTNVRVVSLAGLAGAGYQSIPYEGYEDHAVSVDRAIYESYQTWTTMVDEGYSCYYIQPVSTYDENDFPTYFANAMNAASGTTEDIDFEEITNQIIYAVLSGEITDVIGDDFDLVTDGDACPFTLTVHGEELEATETGENQWSFGTAVDGIYPYVLDYTPDDEATGVGETIVLSSDTPLERSSQLTLSYEVSLKESSTASLDGETTFATNEYAVLGYVDAEGNWYSEEFPVPQVRYTPDAVSEDAVRPAGTKTETPSTGDGTPSTGDGTHGLLPLALMAAGVGFVVAAVITRRKADD